MKMSKPKTVKKSALETSFIVLPEHTNPLGNIFGGTLVAWIDQTAAIVAFRHCRSIAVTVAIDQLCFLHPVKLGEVVILKAQMNFVSKHSMEVHVKVIAENPITGKQVHTSTAYLIFVALDKKGMAKIVPSLRPETYDEKRRFAEGQRRYQNRLKQRK